MDSERRPDPDALLARIHEEERARNRGRLRVFFGAAAGVGKTYAMLEAARQRLAEGVDVVLGYVETHGRLETEALLAGLPEVPRRPIAYRGKALSELDLDAALARAPALILVDELAHTNAPGSRHARRWQDVEELLGAGIDVYTTLNVQHLESLNDVVAQITGVTVRETVPDSVIEGADEVELVDLPPDELLARLEDGKVYVPEQARQALGNFFRKGNLIALRELALRCTADRVDAQMQTWRRAEDTSKTWPVTERILVCISASPSAVRVVRAGRRLARRMRARWTTLYVEEPRHRRLSQADQDYAAQALRLAEQLGAEAVTLGAHDAIEEIVRYARKHNFSKIVAGKPGRFWRMRELVSGSFVGQLALRSGDIDVFIVHGDDERAEHRAPASVQAAWAGWGAYLKGAATVAACTAVTAAMFPWFAPSNLILVYLLGVVVVATRWGRGPAIFAALLSVAAFDVMFVPPYFSFAVAHPEYIVTFAVMAIVAILLSTLTARVREQAEVARDREQRTAALYALSRELASTRSVEVMIAAVRRVVAEVFEGELVVFLEAEDGTLALRPKEGPGFASDPNERAVARWVHEHSRPAGRGTATLAGSEALHLPLVGSRGPVGVLAVRLPERHVPLTTDRMHLLEAFANQAAPALERARLAGEAHRQRLAVEREQLRNALLAAVSHDLRTPLATISGAASSLVAGQERLDAATRAELALTIHEEAERMTRLANDLLDMGRLQAQEVPLKREWQPLEEVVGAALEQLDSRLRGREVTVVVPQDLPLVQIDAVLIERVLVNLLDNALRYTPAGSPIEVCAAKEGDEVVVEVLDRGPGIAAGEERRLFDKFYRGHEAGSARGMGLGLAVARAIVQAHGGRIEARPREGGGAVFRFILPVTGEPPPAEEP